MAIIDYRQATIEDAAAIGALHVVSWRETYRGLLPPDMLSTLSVESRTGMWTAILDAPSNPNAVQVFVAESGGDIIGFGACGGQRDDALRALGFSGEICALYVRRAQQGAGIGRALMARMAGDMMSRSMSAGSLWVLQANVRARAFYEALGAAAIHEKQVHDGENSLNEVAYGWTDLTRLLSYAAGIEGHLRSG